MPSIIVPLSAEGAVAVVLIDISRTRKLALEAINLPIPQAIPTRLLVDTDASITMIAQNHLASLGLPTKGQAPLHSVSTGGLPVLRDQYDVSVIFTSAHPV